MSWMAKESRFDSLAMESDNSLPFSSRARPALCQQVPVGESLKYRTASMKPVTLLKSVLRLRIVPLLM
jgi:hypothetical protein